VVFSSFVMLTLIYGARYSFGVFVKPMFAEYNWPMTVISLAASINLVMYASSGVLAGWLLDRVAPKWITTVSVLLTTAGFIAASFVKSPLGLYLSYGLQPDGELLPPNQSNPHPSVGTVEKPSLKPILADPRFWLLVVCNIFAVMTVMMTFVHQVAYAINNGIDKLEAAAALGFIGIMGPILGGFIFDKTGSYRSGWIMNTIFLLIISLMILALKPSRSRLPR